MYTFEIQMKEIFTEKITLKKKLKQKYERLCCVYGKEEKTFIQNYFPSNLIKCSIDYSIIVVYGCQLKILVNYFSLISKQNKTTTTTKKQKKQNMSFAAIFIIIGFLGYPIFLQGWAKI